MSRYGSVSIENVDGHGMYVLELGAQFGDVTIKNVGGIGLVCADPRLVNEQLCQLRLALTRLSAPDGEVKALTAQLDVITDARAKTTSRFAAYERFMSMSADHVTALGPYLPGLLLAIR